jgi:hypothetical protein
MAESPRRGKRFLGVLMMLGLLGLLGGGLLWLERTPVLAWWYVRGLSRAREAEREQWAARVAELDADALPGLLELLHSDDADACRNARAGLSALAARWGRGDGRTVELTQTLARAFGSLQAAGKKEALEGAAEWCRADGEKIAPPLRLAGARLLGETASVTEPEVHAAALDFCAVLVGQGPEALSPGRELLRASLRASTPALRRQAVQLALTPGMDLLEEVAALLGDPDAGVRRAALLAVGPADKVVLDETLLPCLRDPDDEVRRLCEQALYGRGLCPEHIRLGRLLTAPEPGERLKVLDELRRTPDLDAAVWLRRLSHDPAPSVRAAAVRVMSQSGLDVLDRLDQMARNDPSETVSWLAGYYLRTASRGE